jgi:uncharacterized protein (TIGR03083 family)
MHVGRFYMESPSPMSEPKRIDCVHLFPPLNERLIQLLRALQPDDWSRPTVCAAWDVKDVAAHLLDGMMRRLSFHRDGYSPGGKESRTYAELVAFINQMNLEWTGALRRVSPAMLIDLLERTGREFHAFFETLDPHGPAIFPVAWAGEEYSEHWFDIARDYTEQWIHQQQIRDAVGTLGPLTEPPFGAPAFDTFMRGLPHAFRETTAPDGASVSVEVTGSGGGRWSVLRTDKAWRLVEGLASEPAAAVAIEPDTAWRVVSKRMPADEVLNAFPGIRIEGDAALAKPVLELTSVMA